MKVSAIDFHPMKGHCSEGCEVLFSNESHGFVGADMRGWTFTYKGETKRGMGSANELTRHIISIENQA